MSSTNKTANLQLSQFVGTDVPAWLTDYNSDMQKIDAGVKTASDGVDDAKASVAALEGQVNTNTENITKQGSSIATNAQDITVLQANYETIHHEVAVVEEDVAVLQSKIGIRNVVFIGDDYGLGSLPNGNSTTPWPDLVAGLMGLDSTQWVKNCKSGAGFADTTNGFNTLLTNVAATSSQTFRNGVGSVIVCGGLNDEFNYTEQQIYEGIGAFLNTVKTNFPNAKMYIGHIAQQFLCQNAWNGVAAETYKTPYLETEYLTGCDYALGEYQNAWISAQTNLGAYMPTSFGQQNIAKAIFQAWAGQPFYRTTRFNAPDLFTNQTLDVTATTNNNWMRSRLVNGKYEMYSQYVVFTATNERCKQAINTIGSANFNGELLRANVGASEFNIGNVLLDYLDDSNNVVYPSYGQLTLQGINLGTQNPGIKIMLHAFTANMPDTATKIVIYANLFSMDQFDFYMA